MTDSNDLAALAEQWQAAAVQAFQTQAKEALDAILQSEDPAGTFRAQLESGFSDEGDETEEVSMSEYIDHVLANDQPSENILTPDERGVLTLPDGTQLEGADAEEFSTGYLARLRAWPGQEAGMHPHEFEQMLDGLGEPNEDNDTALTDASSRVRTWSEAMGQ